MPSSQRIIGGVEQYLYNYMFLRASYGGGLNANSGYICISNELVEAWYLNHLFVYDYSEDYKQLESQLTENQIGHIYVLDELLDPIAGALGLSKIIDRESWLSISKPFLPSQDLQIFPGLDFKEVSHSEIPVFADSLCNFAKLETSYKEALLSASKTNSLERSSLVEQVSMSHFLLQSDGNSFGTISLGMSDTGMAGIYNLAVGGKGKEREIRAKSLLLHLLGHITSKLGSINQIMVQAEYKGVMERFFSDIGFKFDFSRTAYVLDAI